MFCRPIIHCIKLHATLLPQQSRIMAFRGLGTRLKDVINRNTYLGSCEIVPYIIAHRVQWNCSQ